MLPTARLTIDLDALAHNFHALRAQAPGAEVAPAVKADGYGLGAAELARRLWAEGARSFFVARLEEGQALRAALGAGRPATLYLLDGALPGHGEALLAAGLVPCLSSLEQAAEWSALAASAGRPLDAALHVDTGMNRLGLRPEEAAALAADPARLAGINVSLVMSHLACANEPGHAMNPRQLAAFRAVRARFPRARASLANSAGCFLGPDYRFDLVRPGIGLYGGGPFDAPDERLAPVAILEAPILQVRHLPAGESVGYGATFTAGRPTRLAVVAAGYADGVLRAFSPDGYGWFRGARRPVAGRLSMDLMAFDITGCDDARPGEMVELLGPNVPLNDAAAAAGTAAYECLVRLSPRARRVVRGEPG